MEYLAIQDILGIDDTTYADVDVWGGTIRIGSLSAAEMIEHTQNNETPIGRKNAGARLIIKSLVDADGKRIGQPSMIGAISQKSIVSISKVVAAIWKLNGRAKEGIDIGDQLRSAGTDTVKLAKLSAELRALADRVDEASGNEEKIKQLLDEPEERAIEARKKDSPATASVASPTVSPVK